ncbi:MAG: cache domain-containing protein [Acidobacteriota bacterium]|nr:cache domain-containing protein [Acidobacteriota bacterium]
MYSAVTRRFTAIGFTLALASFLAAGCDDEASPTTPAPAPPAPAPPPPPAMPEPPQIRAEEVVDRETLRLFVEEAVRIASAGIASADEAYGWFDANFRPEGQWRQGEIYLYAIDLNGVSFFSAATPDLEGTDLSDLTGVEGVRINEELIAAAMAGGGFVEYLWPNPSVEGDEETGSPKLGYAALLSIGDVDLVLGSGIYPPVTAADVRNRGTLKSFVERAASVVAENSPDLETAYAFLDTNFREEGEWRHGQVYVFAQTMELVNFFHAFRPGIEELDRSEVEDLNGVKINQELRAAAQAGGGYVEYWYDNPAFEGDEETGSPKVAYATVLTIGSTPLIFGSGIYPEQPGGE